MTNPDARAWYREHEGRIPDLVQPDASVEEQARQAFELRNTFRASARALMKDRGFAQILDESDPHRTWREVVAKYAGCHPPDRVWAAIIGASQRSRDAADLMLELPFFDDWPGDWPQPGGAR